MPSTSAPPRASFRFRPTTMRGGAFLGLGFVASALLGWFALRGPAIDRDRTYVIAYATDVPFHYPGPDGKPAGLAYELVAEAARRAQIRLRWVPRDQVVDRELWVLQTVRPGRKDTHYTDPYLQSQSWFVVPAESPFRRHEDLQKARISYVDFAVHRDNLARLAPEMQPLPVSTSREALQHMVQGRADAAFINEYSFLPIVLEGQMNRALRIIPSHAPKSQMALSARPDLAPVVDEIRRQMRSMVDDGTLSEFIDRWGWFPNLTTDMVTELVTAQRRARLIQASLAGLSIMLLVAVWLALRSRNQAIKLHQTERTLLERDAWIKTLMEQAGDGIEVLDADGMFLAANSATCGQLGFTEKELLGLGIADIDPVMTRAKYRELFQSLTGNPPLTFETERRRRDGTTFPVEVTFSVVENTREKQGLLLARDITERKRSQFKLSQSEARFRALVEKAPEAIVVLESAEGRIVDANSNACDLFQLRREEIVQHSIIDLSPPQQPGGRSSSEGVRDRVAQAAAGESPRFEWTLWNAARTEVPCEVYFTRLPSSEGVLIRGSLIDVSSRKLLEEQFRRAQKMEAIGQLAGGVAHDFNNILAATMLNLNLLQMNPRLDRETQDILRELESGAKRAAALTRQLLMFSRRSVLEVKVLDLNEVVANLLKMLGRLIGEHFTLVFERGQALPTVEADSGMLEQVLMNLVVNARDAMPKGGRITLATHAVTVDSAQVAANPSRREGRFVCLSVTDTGSGMDAATLKRIFEPFFTTKGAGKGTGVGLATVYGILAQHHGWVEVRSEVGAGSAFHAFLPASLKSTSGPAARVAPALPRGHETILLVEDDRDLRQLLSRGLRHLGYQVLEATTGLEAVQVWQEHHAAIDLLFSDMVMPSGITGLELMEKLRGQKPGLKVIIASGYSSEIEQLGRAEAEGFVYLAKPFEISQLARIIRTTLERR